MGWVVHAGFTSTWRSALSTVLVARLYAMEFHFGTPTSQQSVFCGLDGSGDGVGDDDVGDDDEGDDDG